MRRDRQKVDGGIEITVYRNKEDRIFGYTVAGHHGQRGSSIVCAGVSVLAQTTLKGLGEHLMRIHNLSRSNPDSLSAYLKYKVAEGDVITVEKIEAAEGEAVTFDQVLTVVKDNEVVVGKPVVEGAKVTAKVEAQGKDKKILVFKYKAKSNYRRRQGHRQPFTKVVIEKIEA